MTTFSTIEGDVILSCVEVMDKKEEAEPTVTEG
jgi:hypothetical protein